MVIEKSVRINAPREKVWETFIDASGWSGWQDAVRNVRCHDGKLCLGGGFSFSVRPFILPVKVEAHVDEFVPGMKIAWSGGGFGVRAKHVFTFRDVGDATEVISRETFMGPPIVLRLAGVFLKRLSALSQSLLDDLKRKSEGV